MSFRISAGLVAVLSVAAGSAAAHPHVWIDTRLGLVHTDGDVTAIEVEWRFDDLFSAAMQLDYDADGDGAFSEAETQALASEAFAGVDAYGWFTFPRQGPNEVAVGAAQDFGAALEDGRLVYRFTLPLATPLDPKAGLTTVTIYDQDFYIDLRFAETEPVRFVGGPACAVSVTEDGLNLVFQGNFFPQMVEITC